MTENEMTTEEEIITALEEVKERGLVVWLDNDHVGASDPEQDYESILRCHPERLMGALLSNFGVEWDHV